MKHSIQKMTRIGLSLFLLAVLMAGALALSSTRSARALTQTSTMEYDRYWFDLETGTAISVYPEDTPPTATDFKFSYGGLTPHAVLHQNNFSGVQIAYSTETYANVHFDDIAALTFTTSRIAQPFDQVAVLLTSEGNYFKIGFVSESDTDGTVTFQWEQLTSPRAAIETLQGDIQSLVVDGTLKTGQANGLIHPLNNAIRSLDKGHTNSACNQLDDFITDVNEKTPTPLDAATAADLISSAEAIKTSIDCE